MSRLFEVWNWHEPMDIGFCTFMLEPVFLLDVAAAVSKILQVVKFHYGEGLSESSQLLGFLFPFDVSAIDDVFFIHIDSISSFSCSIYGLLAAGKPLACQRRLSAEPLTTQL